MNLNSQCQQSGGGRLEARGVAGCGARSKGGGWQGNVKRAQKWNPPTTDLEFMNLVAVNSDPGIGYSQPNDKIESWLARWGLFSRAVVVLLPGLRLSMRLTPTWKTRVVILPLV